MVGWVEYYMECILTALPGWGRRRPVWCYSVGFQNILVLSSESPHPERQDDHFFGCHRL